MLAFCKGTSSDGLLIDRVEAIDAFKGIAPKAPLATAAAPPLGGSRSAHLTVPAPPAQQWNSEASGAISNCSTLAVSKRIESKSLKEFSQLYEIGSKVQVSGLSGPSGTFVYYATRISDGAGVAVKAINKALAFEGCVRDELDWLKTVKAQLQWPTSDGICDLLEVIQTDTHYYMVMEKFEGQDLWAWRSRAKVHFEHGIVRAIVKQTLQAVAVMHGAGIIHRDLKLENIWVNMEKGWGAEPDSIVRVKLVDFDAATTCTERESYLIGSHGYCAPETYEGHYSAASDMFAIGVIMYKLMTRRFPFNHTSFEVRLGEDSVGSNSMKRIFKQLQGAEVDYSLSPLDKCPEAADLLKSLLSVKPRERLSAQKALSHDWFALAGSLPEYQP